MVKPKLYIPDYTSYGVPFGNNFQLVHDPKRRYDVDLMLECDFLLLTGGEDISPTYYGHQPIKETQYYPNNPRDQKEFLLGMAAIDAGMPIIGVCRGAQWLSIFAGGSLIQHVDNHWGGSHVLHTCDEDIPTVKFSSAHHQMCDLHKVHHKLLAWTEHLSNVYLGENGVNLYPNGLTKEPEIFYIPDVDGFGIQGHPEYMDYNSPGNKFVRKHLTHIFEVNSND